MNKAKKIIGMCEAMNLIAYSEDRDFSWNSSDKRLFVRTRYMDYSPVPNDNDGFFTSQEEAIKWIEQNYPDASVDI